MGKIKTFGSLCSGIEAASFVLEPLGVKPLWLSEIADFQSRFLKEKYSGTPNLGDMNDIPQLIDNGVAAAPDLVCGGTPCQAFSLAGWRNGINDDRGQLTLKYIDIVDAIDRKRREKGQCRTVFFWENVEGALTDKTNAFGCFLAGLIGLDEPLISPLGEIKRVVDKDGNETVTYPKWPNAGVINGVERNIAWRVLDAKYFGLPQQRRRIYLLGGGKDFHPEEVLFEKGGPITDPFKNDTAPKLPSLFEESDHTDKHRFVLTKEVDGHKIEAFRSYSDCLYAAYGTKWNGNAAAFNGSLFFAQDGRLRRLNPLECERLMGFPDNYTLLDKCRDTQRYQAAGNSWAVPVIRWIANRLINTPKVQFQFGRPEIEINDTAIHLLEDFNKESGKTYINASKIPYDFKVANMVDIVDVNCAEKFYITEAGCLGILRRKYEHKAGMNERLEAVLKNCVSPEELRKLTIT